MRERLLKILSQFRGKRILVLGDVMLDQYIWGKVSRISPEAPVPVVEVERVTYSPGGAANVAMNVANLQGKVSLVGVIGDDQEGDWLKRTFVDNQIDIKGLITDRNRPTTLKTRIIAHSQQVVRMDREMTESVDKTIAQKLLNYSLTALRDIDAILISDYAKGVTVRAMLEQIIFSFRKAGKIVVVDPKGYDYSKYKGATAVTPNKQEAAQAVNMIIENENDLLHAGKTLLRDLNCEAVLVTRGEEGMSLFESSGNITHLPAVSREVFDITGAGDTVTSTFTIALTTGAAMVDCARVANYAAGIVVGKVGTAVVSIQELKKVIAQDISACEGKNI